MRCAVWLVMGVFVGACTVAAVEKPLNQLPQDLLTLADAATQPIQEVHRETRRLDPISSVWFGLLEGSVKSVEHTAKFLFDATKEDDTSHARPGKNPIVKYSF